MVGTYFVTSRTWESRSLFTSMPACKIFIEALLQYRDQGAYQLHAFVLMPDHFHVLITPTSNVTLERAVQYIKGGSARRLGEELRLRFPVWQRGFSDHRIRDTEDYQNHVYYIEQNPVKERLVKVVNEYPWSSASGEFPLDEAPQGLKPRTELISYRHG
ncbi:MAG: transposase [Acidobacteria bacterium]|nr:transposase [Acidobacteriota bacterium]